MASVALSDYELAQLEHERLLAPLRAENEQLREVVRQAYQFAMWMRLSEWYILSSKAAKKLAALEAAARAVLAEGERECPTMPHQAFVASVEPRPPTTAETPREEYLTTVAAIAQRLSDRPSDAPPDSPPTKSAPLPSEPSHNCSFTDVCDCGSSPG